jgi:putative phosphoesterase
MNGTQKKIAGLKVAALYDVHGNAPALEAVLEEAQAEGVDAIVFGGDIAAGPLPRETLELVQSVDAVCVQGNADLLNTPVSDSEGEAGRRFIVEQLDDEQVRWLVELPFSTVIDDTLYLHATPQGLMGIVTEVTTDERFAEVLSGVEQPRVVAGHTHMQLRKQVGDVLFINAGSVGMPYEGEPGAYWALIGDEVEFRRTDYDLEQAAAAIRASGHPLAEELAAENVLRVPSRAEALSVFGG